MYRHLKITSLTQMNDEIIKFLANLLGISDNTNTIKILSKNGKNMMWFVKDPARDGFATWIGDTIEIGNPWEHDATVGVAGKYRLDMWRKEIDAGETASAKAKMRDQNQKGYDLLMERVDDAVEKRNAYLIWYYNEKKIEKDVEVYKDVCHRMETTNAFHVGGLLKYSEVPMVNGFKWLDCLYNDGSFMFTLYSTSLPHITRSLIIGELETYQSNISGKTYFMSNSWIIKSYTKQGSYNDSFFLEDIVGEDRIPSQQQAISMGENKIIDNYLDSYHEAQDNETEKKNEMIDKNTDWDTKRHQANEKREAYNVAKVRSDTARADADQETDPEAKARKETWAEELEATTQRLDEEATELENIASEAEQEYIQARQEYDDARDATEGAYQNAKNAYIDIFSKTLQDVGIKEDNLHHHVANCVGEEQIITYNNDIFCAYRLDVDADITGDADYSVNGHRTAFHLHTAPKDLHLRYYDTSARYYPPESLTSQRVVSWEHQILHYSYECEESNVGANIYPLLDTVKKEYEIYDTLAKEYKPFQCFSRSGTGGNSVNNVNNVSTIVPLIFYVERDAEERDTWSATGQTTIVNYVNMYNMGTGTMFHSQQHHAENLFGCYDLWRRRMEITPWNPVINDEDNEWKEVWGFGGYPGIAFKTKLKDDFTELRRRVVV